MSLHSLAAVEHAPYPFSRLEDLADDCALDPDELRAYLRAEIERRQRARYSMHAHAYVQLDARLERLAATTSQRSLIGH